MAPESGISPIKYNLQSWTDPRIKVGMSSIDRRGLFTTAAISVGELVSVWGGKIFTRDEINAGNFRPHTAASISEDLYIALPKGSTVESIDEFMNHSCNPNTWLIDEVTLVAARDIAPKEEVTMDYVTWEADENYVFFTACKCGGSLCRGVVTGRDWRREDLQQRYRGHFSPFIERRIDKLLTPPQILDSH